MSLFNTYFTSLTDDHFIPKASTVGILQLLPVARQGQINLLINIPLSNYRVGLKNALIRHTD